MKGSRRANNQKKFSSKKGAKPPQNQKLVQRDENPRIFPVLQDQLSAGFVFRFITTVPFTGSYSVTWTNLLDAWFLAGSATTAWQLFDFVKIKSITMRAMGAPDPAYPLAPTCTIGVEFPGLIGGQFGGGKQKVEQGMGTDMPALLQIRPDPMSQTAQFQPSTTNVAFVFRAVDGRKQPLVGAMIDVQVVLRNSADIAPAAVTTARAGMTGGQVYFGGIDGLLPANTVARTAFVPVA